MIIPTGCRQKSGWQRALTPVLQSGRRPLCSTGVLLLLLLTGCRTGPDYQPADPQPVAEWVEPARLESDPVAEGIEVNPEW
jgi:hypothetical protein